MFLPAEGFYVAEGAGGTSPASYFESSIAAGDLKSGLLCASGTRLATTEAERRAKCAHQYFHLLVARSPRGFLLMGIWLMVSGALGFPGCSCVPLC